MRQRGFFEIEDWYARLDKAGDPLASLDAVVDWRGLAASMNRIARDVRTNGGKGGRPPLSELMMAKILILQSGNNLADDVTEFLINDRLSFKRFLGLGANDKAPDAKTIWLWRERVLHGGVHEKIFAWFENELCRAGYAAKGGQIVDATVVPTHQPTGKHKKQLREEVPLTPGQARQIDSDATFVKKGDATHHGYKNHTNIDREYTLIRAQDTTTARVHDSQKFADVLVEQTAAAAAEDRAVWADSAYRGAEAEAMLTARNLTSQVHERADRNTPLTDLQKAANSLKSSVSARVEPVYGQMAPRMGGLMIHTLTLARASVKVTFKNLAYNMQRFVFLMSRRRQEQCV